MCGGSVTTIFLQILPRQLERPLLFISEFPSIRRRMCDPCCDKDVISEQRFLPQRLVWGSGSHFVGEEIVGPYEDLQEGLLCRLTRYTRSSSFDILFMTIYLARIYNPFTKYSLSSPVNADQGSATILNNVGGSLCAVKIEGPVQ